MIPTRNRFITAWPNDAHSFCLTAIRALKHVHMTNIKSVSPPLYLIGTTIVHFHRKSLGGFYPWHAPNFALMVVDSRYRDVPSPLGIAKSPHASSAALFFFSFLYHSRPIWWRRLNHLSWQRGIITPCGSQRQGKGDSSTVAAAPEHNVDVVACSNKAVK